MVDEFYVSGPASPAKHWNGTEAIGRSHSAKVKVQIAEGQFFERREEQEHTFKEMMERYVAERATLKAPKSRLRDHAALGHLLTLYWETEC
jgi:hypothetical protein